MRHAQVFQEYLLDADWSVNAGNWMWVSSSAFENFLDTSDTISPVNYGRMFEPTGEYIRCARPQGPSLTIAENVHCGGGATSPVRSMWSVSPVGVAYEIRQTCLLTSCQARLSFVVA